MGGPSIDKSCSLAWITLALFAGKAESQTATPIQSDASQSYLFSTKVELVVLNATVRDKKGWLVSDLTQSDFELSEDGVPQNIRLFQHEDIPVAVALVVDHSGSMAPKLAEVIAAARTFVASSRSDDDMFVVNFNENVTLELSAGRSHANRRDQLALAIASRPTQGRTALYDAVIKASAELQTASQKKKVLIVISDGGDNASSHTLADVLSVVGRSNALVYTIGVFDEDDLDRNPAALRRLAHISGGEAFLPQQLSEIVSICEHIARDIRNQYTVGYVSSNPAQPGTYHSIRLVARAAGKGKLAVRTRAGYIAGETTK
jgi:VWFA-related protein